MVLVPAGSKLCKAFEMAPPLFRVMQIRGLNPEGTNQHGVLREAPRLSNPQKTEKIPLDTPAIPC